jgi:pimeloyl-ACP methyl ester carboxylesterase
MRRSGDDDHAMEPMLVKTRIVFKWLRWCLSAIPLCLLSACYPIGNATRPIPTAFVAAPQAAHRLVVFLPGRGDDLQGLKKSGIAQIIQREWPDADVELAAVTMAYYLDGNATKRLHDEVMAPALSHGYQQIWLAGTSLGGMGALTYDRDYPGEVYGMILLAPYLGDSTVPKEIVAAGGLAQWNPGPAETLSSQTWQRELWRYLKGWSSDPGKTRHVWLAYGDHDRLRKDIELMSPTLRSTHVLMLPGGHSWKVWKVAAPQLLRDVSRDESTPPAHRQNLQE